MSTKAKARDTVSGRVVHNTTNVNSTQLGPEEARECHSDRLGAAFLVDTCSSKSMRRDPTSKRVERVHFRAISRIGPGSEFSDRHARSPMKRTEKTERRSSLFPFRKASALGFLPIDPHTGLSDRAELGGSALQSVWGRHGVPALRSETTSKKTSRRAQVGHLPTPPDKLQGKINQFGLRTATFGGYGRNQNILGRIEHRLCSTELGWFRPTMF